MSAPGVKQAGRYLEFKTPSLAADTLVINSFAGSESLSSLYHYNLELLAPPDKKVAIKDLLGKPCHVGVRIDQRSVYHFHGIISRISQGNRHQRFQQFEAEVVPWLWLLTRRSDCRIFEHKTVIEIIKEVFDKYKTSYADVVKLTEAQTGTYQKLDYCVQYRETDFNFVSRLMEQYGISYFFEHTETSHSLVLADANTAYKTIPGHNPIRFEEGGYGEREDVIDDWHGSYQLNSKKYTLRDYHLELTNKTLEVAEGDGDLELYDFPGGYAEPYNDPDNNSKVISDGEHVAKLRLEEQELGNYVCEGSSDCRNFKPGFKFNLVKHSSADGEYIITSVNHNARQSPDYFAAEDIQHPYRNTFTCVPSKTPIRPQRVTKKPIVSGPQTATVTVKSGEESWLDKYGRVRIKFHWDRLTNQDEKSTCWVRVSQSWAANQQWGAHFWPRKGHEVVVDFLEGDPDQPIITGSVYNAQNMPPYELAKYYTRSGFKTRSSKDGSSDNYNELRFEDLKDKEQIYIQAEKDMDERVKNDSREYIGNDRHLIVKNEQHELIEKDKHLHIKGKQFEKIEDDFSLEIVKKQKQKVGGDKSLEVGGNLKEKVTGNVSLDVTGEAKEKVTMKKSVKAMDIHEKADMSYAMDAGMTVHIKAGMAAVIEAGAQLTLKVGGNFIDLNPAGISIQGTMVLINSGGAAGAGAGSSPSSPDSPDAPDAPKDPDEADDGSKGTKKA